MQALWKEKTQGFAERRLTQRVRKAWDSHAEEGLPSWSDLREDAFGEDWASCFAIDLTLTAPSPYFIYVGDALEEFSQVWVRERGTSEQSVIDLVAAGVDDAALNRTPCSIDTVQKIDNDRRIVLRAVLLPLSEDGETVTHIFGAANGRLLGAHSGKV